MTPESYRQKADEVLRQAIKTTDLNMKGLLLQQAMELHQKAMESLGEQRAGRANGHGRGAPS